MLAAIALALLMAAAVAYAERRAIARAVLAGWLRSQGVDAQIDLKGLGASGLTAVLRLGPAADPDFTVESAEIRYDLGWGPGGLAARPTEIRLVRPMLKARWHGGKLSFGSLDRLIETLLKRPPEANPILPALSVDQARLVLDTDAGRLIGHGAGRFDKGRLQRLDLATDAATLKGRDLVALLAPGDLHLSLAGERMAVTGQIALTSLRGPRVELDAARLDLTGHAPYPDLRLRREAGPVDLAVTTVARGGRLDRIRLDGLKQSASLQGQMSGWGDQLGLGGVAVVGLEADRLAVGQTLGRGVKLQALSRDFTWSRSQGDHLLGVLAMTAELKGLDQGALRLVDLAARLEGPAAARAGDVRLDLAGSVATRGSWTGLGLPAAADTPDDAALKRALANFRVSAPRLTVRVSQDGLALGLGAPARLATDTGGAGALAGLYAHNAGAFRLTLDGRGGLPRADLAVDRYRLAGGEVSGQARLDATASLGPMTGAHLKLAGPFRIAGGGFEIRPDACAELSVDRISFGDNDLEALAGQLCPAAGPLFALAPRGWRAVGEARGVSARAPFLEAVVTGAAGPVALGGHGDQLEMSAEVKTARLEDRAAPRRFQPILAKGSAVLNAGLAHGAFVLSDPQGRRLATATLDHRMAEGVGQIDFDTGPLAFAPGGLQPAALSPRAGVLGSPVQGEARFSGQLAWGPKGTTGGGTLTVGRLDFRSPAGKVTNLRGQVIFDGLSPLHAAPGQTLRADSVAALVPLTGVVGIFGLEPDAANVAQVSFGLAGGQVRAEPFVFPLAEGAAWRASVDVDGVQLADLVAATSFADQLDLDARVSGRMPFAVTPEGVRFTQGELHAIAPGRLSIHRGALSQVATQGGAPIDPKAAPAAPAAPAAAASPYSDFVNQALEHLSFSELKAQVNSLAGGRLGVLFHIKGQHQPPQDQQIRLTWREALTRRIDRQLPLPSGTGIDLTLDTSLNLDQLLKDFADYQSLRGSGAVQPPGPSLPPNARRRP